MACSRVTFTSTFFYAFISQHAPLLMSNTTCIVLNYTYYDLSCLYTFYNIYLLPLLCSSFQFILSTYSLKLLWYCTPNLLQLTGQLSVLVTTAFSLSLSFSRRGQSNIICCTVCGPFLQGHVGSSSPLPVYTSVYPFAPQDSGLL